MTTVHAESPRLKATKVRIAPKSAKRTKRHANGRATHPRVARAEIVVEAMTTIRGDGELFEAAVHARREVRWARAHVCRDFQNGKITRDKYADSLGDLDRLDRRIDDMELDRKARLHQHILPELERYYHQVEYAF